MSLTLPQVDCDVHVQVPNLQALLPYFDDYWREMIRIRGIDGFEALNYPPNAPLTCRPDWRDESGLAGGNATTIARRVLDERGIHIAVLNCLYGVQVIHDDFMAAAFARSVNDWIAEQFLARDTRFRASIVIPLQNPALAVEEIEHRANDRRFVQVLVLAAGDLPLGRSVYEPVFAAAERFGLPVGIHAGSAYRQALTCNGWPSTHLEAYVDLSQAFQAQVASLITHGVLRRHPKLRIVLLGSGVSWMPAFLWRLTKFWQGVRIEAPWMDRPPAALVREQIRLTLQPFDTPPSAGIVEKVIEHLGSDDVLLYGSDYPHWQFDGDDILPAGLPDRLRQKVFSDNPLAVYQRIGGAS